MFNRIYRITTAMCIWEEHLQLDGSSIFSKLQEEVGVAQLREDIAKAVDLLDATEAGMQLAIGAGYCQPFDMEFVPWFMANCVTVNGGVISPVEDWEVKCLQLGIDECKERMYERATTLL